MSTTVTRAAMNRAEAFLHLRRLGWPASGLYRVDSVPA